MYGRGFEKLLDRSPNRPHLTLFAERVEGYLVGERPERTHNM